MLGVLRGRSEERGAAVGKEAEYCPHRSFEFRHIKRDPQEHTAHMQQRLFIVGAKRTPFGAFGGKLKGLTATDLAVKATAAALSAAKVNPAAVDSVCIGNVQQTSPDAAYLARHVALKCDMATETPALNINRLCGSGFQSVVNIAHEILVGEAQICADTYVPGLPCLLCVRVTRTSLLRAVRTGGAGQLAPGGAALCQRTASGSDRY